MGAGSSAPLAQRRIFSEFTSGISESALIGEVGMEEENRFEKIARLSGKATTKGLDALARHGFDLRKKLSAPISRVPRRAPLPEKPKSDE
jgi:hypothetical protein